MASRLADARAALHNALAPVLPGRVDPYPPHAGRVVAPKIWIGDHDGNPATIGSATTVTVARFAVWIVYDGAVHAQVAGIDDLTSAVIDAIEGAYDFEHDGWRPATLTGVPIDSTLRATVVTATVTIVARTLCPAGPPTFDVVDGPNDVIFTPIDRVPSHQLLWRSDMSAPSSWRIQSGVLAFTDVDPLAVGYLPAWMAPGGATADTADFADYEADSTFWSCNVTAGALTPAADSTTQDQPATFCQLGETIPTPKLSTWTLDVEMIQDPHVATGVAPAQTMGLAEYLYLHDAVEVFFLLGLNGTMKAPRAVGRVVLSAATFGGVAQEILVASGSWPTNGKPDIAWGQTTVTPTGLVVQQAKREKASA